MYFIHNLPVTFASEVIRIYYFWKFHITRINCHRKALFVIKMIGNMKIVSLKISMIEKKKGFIRRYHYDTNYLKVKLT